MDTNKRVSKNKLVGVRHYYRVSGKGLLHHHWACVWNMSSEEQPYYVSKTFSVKNEMPAYAREFLEKAGEPCLYCFDPSNVFSLVVKYYGSTDDVHQLSDERHIVTPYLLSTDMMVLYNSCMKDVADYNLAMYNREKPSKEQRESAKASIKLINQLRAGLGLKESTLILRRKLGL